MYLKKRVFLVISLILIFTGTIFFFLFRKNVSSLSVSQNNVSDVTINVCNWGEFISDGSGGSLNVNEEFTRRTGIKVNYTTFQSNEALFAKLKNKSIRYDVIFPSEYMVAKLIKNNMLKKLDYSHIPNANLIDPSLKNQNYDSENEYSVPYVFGVVSIIYNKKFVKEDPKNIDWDILWNKKYKNKILMFDNPRDALAIAQIKLGYDLNSKEEMVWKNAYNYLKNQKDLVQAYVMDQIFDKMANEEAFIAPYYLGDALNLREKNANLGVVIPKSGTNKFLDLMCIPENANHPREALEYINFLCSPKISKANCEHIQYFSPIVGLNNIDKVENVENLNRIFEKGFTKIFTDLPEDINVLLKDLWINLKIEDKNNFVEFWVIFGTVLLLIFLSIFIKRKKMLQVKE